MRKKSFILLAVSLTMTATLLVGCGNTNNQKIPTTSPTETASVVTTVDPSTSTETFTEEPSDSTATSEVTPSSESQDAVAEDSFSFADISNLEFWFGSGAGAWCTTLHVRDDGSFFGYYHDSDMGDSGDKYPDGTCYESVFEGQFSEPKKVNDYTYSVTIESMKTEKKENTQEIKDGIRYIYSEPYGLENSKNILFYLPGTSIKDLPESFVTWMNAIDLPKEKDAKLTFYGLYNEKPGYGFSSYEGDSAYPIDDDLKQVEEDAAAIEKKLRNAETQLEMNLLSGELYQLWDDELNAIWKLLKNTLDKEAMEELTRDEREWIAEKEKAVKKAGSGSEGGSIQPLIENTKAAELTKQRVYELADYVR